MLWFHDRLVPEAEAKVSALDRGFLHGDGLFETLRCYDGRPAFWQEHVDRLAASAKELRIPWPADLAGPVRAVLDANGLRGDARVRITVTRGPGAFGDMHGTPTLLVTAEPVALPDLAAGARAIVSRHRVLSGQPAMKSTSFQLHALAKAEARAAGAWEALLPNELGELAEGATSNLFALHQGKLVTPPLGAGCLPGVTRAQVLRLAPGLGVPAVERPLSLSMLRGAGEAFLTSSVAEVVPLVALDDAPIGSGAPGPVTRRVAAVYREAARASANGNPMRNGTPK
ncbi:MAG: aminotransferase class IV [Halobacteriales archaeon]|nr:aminotransferase class IV [Halobacteriales archaeon]